VLEAARSTADKCPRINRLLQTRIERKSGTVVPSRMWVPIAGHLGLSRISVLSDRSHGSAIFWHRRSALGATTVRRLLLAALAPSAQTFSSAEAPSFLSSAARLAAQLRSKRHLRPY
jgi:hypothetical protein